MTVVCDSTVFIGLAKIGKIELLKQIYKEIYIPEAVFAEVAIKGRGRPGAKEVANAGWIYKKPVKDKRTVEMLAAEIGHGEAEVLVLGKELNADWLKLISFLKPILEALRNKNFRISDNIYKEVLKKAGER